MHNCLFLSNISLCVVYFFLDKNCHLVKSNTAQCACAMYPRPYDLTDQRALFPTTTHKQRSFLLLHTNKYKIILISFSRNKYVLLFSPNYSSEVFPHLIYALRKRFFYEHQKQTVRPAIQSYKTLMAICPNQMSGSVSSFVSHSQAWLKNDFKLFFLLLRVDITRYAAHFLHPFYLVLMHSRRSHYNHD